MQIEESNGDWHGERKAEGVQSHRLYVFVKPRRFATFWEKVGESLFWEPLSGEECRGVSMFDFFESSMMLEADIAPGWQEKEEGEIVKGPTSTRNLCPEQ